jgi:hypothetical protein
VLKLERNLVVYFFGTARRSQPCDYVVVFWLVRDEPVATTTPCVYIHAQEFFRQLLKQFLKLQYSFSLGKQPSEGDLPTWILFSVLGEFGKRDSWVQILHIWHFYSRRTGHHHYFRWVLLTCFQEYGSTIRYLFVFHLLEG